MLESLSTEKQFPTTASICLTGAFCACLILGSYNIALAIPFAIVLVCKACQALGMVRSIAIGFVICLCSTVFIEGDTFQSLRPFGHVGDRLHLPPDSFSCVAEMGPVTVVNVSTTSICSTSSLLPEGDYIITDVSFGDGLGHGGPHVPTLHPFYRIDTPDGPGLVEVPFRLLERGKRRTSDTNLDATG